MEKANKRLMYFGGIIIAVILVISIFFHYPIHVVESLTQETLSDYDFHIPILKILLEPFIGVILFFNRSVYALEEQQFLFYWVLIIFSVYTFLKLFVVKDRQAKKGFMLNQLANLPITVGLWFTLFVIMIFMSSYLPSNTIINNSPNTILVSTHSHSQESHDGLIRNNALWKWHKRNGFDAFFLTNHATHNGTIDFINSQRNGKFPIEPLIICGQEYSASNHFSLLGLKRKFDTHGYADSTVIDSVHANGGALIVNHWFDGEHMSLEYYKNLGVDGFEIENSGTVTSYDREQYQRIKNFCESNNLIMISGLDFHGYGNVCTMWNAIEIPGWHDLIPTSKEEAILNVIKSRDQNKLKVLIYKDRPFYTSDHLFWSPFFTLFNYFRTLNFWQVLSWAIWISIIVFIKIKILTKEELKNKFATNKIIPVLGMVSAIFILGLASVYFAEMHRVLDTENDVYKEYSELLFFIGSIFLIFSGGVAWFRVFRRKKLKIN